MQNDVIDDLPKQYITSIAEGYREMQPEFARYLSTEKTVYPSRDRSGPKPLRGDSMTWHATGANGLALLGVIAALQQSWSDEVRIRWSLRLLVVDTRPPASGGTSIARWPPDPSSSPTVQSCSPGTPMAIGVSQRQSTLSNHTLGLDDMKSTCSVHGSSGQAGLNTFDVGSDSRRSICRAIDVVWRRSPPAPTRGYVGRARSAMPRW